MNKVNTRNIFVNKVNTQNIFVSVYLIVSCRIKLLLKVIEKSLISWYIRIISSLYLINIHNLSHR